MVFYLFHRNRTHPLGNQPRETFMDSHAEGANTLGAEPQSRGQHQIGPVRLQQISGTDIGLKPLGNQGDDVHQGLRRLATLSRQIGDFLEGQDIIFIFRGSGLAHVLNGLFVRIQFRMYGAFLCLH